MQAASGTTVTQRARLEIGAWSANPSTNELSRNGETVRIEPKAMEVLMLLAERAGEVTSREALFASVWPGVVVGDEALTQCVIKLRRALGDNPRAPSYIETISKRGYRLIAPVRQVKGEPGTRVDTQLPSRGLMRRARDALVHNRLVVALLIGLLVVSGAYIVHDQRRSAVVAQTFDAAGEREASLVTVTVLPFESLGGDDEQAYLARGISNDLMAALSRLPELRVIGSSGAPVPSQTAPGARYLISGSVQRGAGKLRIGINLIDTDTNRQLWSDRFERPIDDLFSVQDEIIQRLTESLPAKLTDAARQRLARRHTRSLEAYDDFLRGQALFLVRRVDENEAARALYRKALELDPEFARAYAGVAMTYAMEHILRQARGDSPLLARAFELAEAARLIDPELPEIHWALGFVHAQARRHDLALQSLQRAIDLNRSYADAYALTAGVYTYSGRPARSIPLLRTAMRLNPDGGYLYFLLLGRAYLFENDSEQALINLREAAARNPVNLETRIYLAAALVAAGDRRAAEWEVQEIRALDAGFSLQGWLETYPLTSERHVKALEDLLAKVGL